VAAYLAASLLEGAAAAQSEFFSHDSETAVANLLWLRLSLSTWSRSATTLDVRPACGKRPPRACSCVRHCLTDCLTDVTV
jgi:hypothetical protein